MPAPTGLLAAWQLTVGTVVSVTVKVVVQVALLPASSVAVTVIVFVPNPTSVPAAGRWTTGLQFGPREFSFAVSPPNTFGTAPCPAPSSLALVSARHLTVGPIASVT